MDPCCAADLSLANATLCLGAFGHIVVVWLWLRQAILASQALAATPAANDVDFYRGKVSAVGISSDTNCTGPCRKSQLVAALDDTCLRMRVWEFTGA